MIESQRMSGHDRSGKVFCGEPESVPGVGSNAAGAVSITVCRIGGPCGGVRQGLAGCGVVGRSRGSPRRRPIRYLSHMYLNVSATTVTVTVQSIRYSSVQLEPDMSVPLDQIPTPHDTRAADARRPVGPVGPPPHRRARVPSRHAHAVDPQTRAGQRRVALHGGRGVRTAGRARLSGVAARLRIFCARPTSANDAHGEIHPTPQRRRRRPPSTWSGCCATCCIRRAPSAGRASVICRRAGWTAN